MKPGRACISMTDWSVSFIIFTLAVKSQAALLYMFSVYKYVH